MKGFGSKSEITHIIIRVGPNCEKYGDPYSDCVHGRELPSGELELFGYVGKPTLETVRLTYRIAKEMGYDKVIWDRESSEPYSINLETEKEGKIKMSRNRERKVHTDNSGKVRDFVDLSAFDMHKGRDGNNEIDLEAVKEEATKLLAAIVDGSVVIKTIETTAIARGGEKRRARIVIESELAE